MSIIFLRYKGYSFLEYKCCSLPP